MPQVSVIIPVYNTQNYLKKCLDSVCNQTLSDIEIICVNDCSTDNSLDILTEYSKKDSRIKLIDFKENKGAAIARNTGIDEAKGEYIGFVDSDDFIDLDFYEKLYLKVLEFDLDIAIGNIDFFNGSEYISFNESQRILAKVDKINFCCLYTIGLYKRKMILDNEIKFSSFKVGEDYIFSILSAYFAKKIDFVDDVYYHYIKNNFSLSNNKNQLSKKQAEFIRAVIDVFKKINILNLTIDEYKKLTNYFFTKVFEKIKSNNFLFTIEHSALYKILYECIKNPNEILDKDNIEISDFLLNVDISGLIKYLNKKQMFEQISIKTEKIKKLNSINTNKLLSLKNKYNRKRCFIIGSSPSLSQLDLSKLNSEYTFTVNRGYMLKQAGLFHSTFHVISDINTFSDNNSKSEDMFSYSDTIFSYAGIKLPKNADNFIYFDFMDFNGKKNDYSFDIVYPLYSFESVIHYAIQIAVYLGFVDIYLIGVDLDFIKNKGHAYKETDGEKYRQLLHSIKSAKIMLSGIEYISKILPKGVKLYNASPCGVVDCIPRVEYKELFSV